jgi:anti-anti-sigma factor
MDKKPFEMTVRMRDGTAIVEMLGDVDAAATERLGDVHAETADAADIVLDFSRVDYVNSSGIALIVGLLAKARVAGQHVAAFGLTSHYRHIFEITRLSDFMTIHDHAPAEFSSPAPTS